MRGRELHLHVDGGGAHVERAAEDVWEAKHVVDLVRIVAATGAEDHVAARGLDILIGDFGVRVSHRKDDGVAPHAPDHLLRKAVGDRKADKDVGSHQRVGQRAALRRRGKACFVLVHAALATGVDDAGAVAHEDVGVAGAQGDVEVGHGDAGRARAVNDDADIANGLANDLERVEETRAGDDGRAVLVVVEDGNVAAALGFLFDKEALRGLDVFQIDAAEGGRDHLDEANDFLRVGGVDFDVEDVDIGEALEKDGLPFHDRLGGLRATVAQAEDRRAVADHGDEVGFGGVVVGKLGMAGNLKHRIGDAGRIRKRQVLLGVHGLGGNDL